MIRWGRMIVYVWALPGTAVGIPAVLAAVLGGGTVRVVDGVLEVEGELVRRVLGWGFPWVGPVSAITLGHVVVGFDRVSLERTRRHERVHVRQYERWGPFFIPAYVACSLVCRLRGRDPYRDNRFEREAYGEAG